MERQEAQAAGCVLMVRPALFGFNPQTAASNAFQRDPVASPADTRAAALAEFDAVAGALAEVGIEVIVAADTVAPVKPDAVFPNNWVSFHADGSVVLYPMLAANRRFERREEIIRQVIRDGDFHVARTIDLSYREAEEKYLEGTGSVVLDRRAHIAYACLSARTDLDVLGEFAQRLDYEAVAFDASDGSGLPIYHTNVLMGIGTRFAVVCGAAIADPRHRAAVFGMLTSSGHEIIDISRRQMHAFAGNCLELASPRGQLIILSTTAWDALEEAQRRTLAACGEVLRVEIPTIERFGGGGVRCMLADVHLPRRVGRAGLLVS